MNRLLKKTKDIVSLSKKIAESEMIKKYNQSSSKKDPESWVIAYSLSEIEESCQKISIGLLKKLADAETREQVDCVLFDIREELRHILYHIKDSEFFRNIL
jgi:hypothetical protein